MQPGWTTDKAAPAGLQRRFMTMERATAGWRFPDPPHRLDSVGGIRGGLDFEGLGVVRPAFPAAGRNQVPPVAVGMAEPLTVTVVVPVVLSEHELAGTGLIG